MGWMIGGSRPCSEWVFFSSPPFPDRLWGPVSYQMGNRGSFLGGKAVGA